MRGKRSRSGAVQRWQQTEFIREYLRALHSALHETWAPAWVDFADDPAAAAREAAALGLKPPTLEEDWRRDAVAIGLTTEQSDESWQWFRRHAFEGSPVVEEVGQAAARLTLPETVRRVLQRNPLYGFVGYDADLVEELFGGAPAVAAEAEDWQFWHDISYAYEDLTSSDARHAIDRVAKLVRIKPEHGRTLANTLATTMEDAKRRVVQEAILLSIAAAEGAVRVGSRITPSDTARPLRLEDVFGRAGLQEVLGSLIRENPGDADAQRAALQAEVGGPFRPDALVDRSIYREWLVGEIRRRAVQIVGEDLDVSEPGRFGGARRKMVSYDETEPLPEVPRVLGPRTRELTAGNLNADAEREERELAVFPTAGPRVSGDAIREKERLEGALADRLDLAHALDHVLRIAPGPVLQQYLQAVRQEPLLWDDDVAAERALNWTSQKVRDVKRRVRPLIARRLAEERWKSLNPNKL